MAIHLKFFVDCRSRQASFAMTNSVFICRAAEESSTTIAGGKFTGCATLSLRSVTSPSLRMTKIFAHSFALHPSRALRLTFRTIRLAAALRIF